MTVLLGLINHQLMTILIVICVCIVVEILDVECLAGIVGHQMTIEITSLCFFIAGLAFGLAIGAFLGHYGL